MKFSISILLLLFTGIITAQDSVVVYQKGAVLFSNRYVFFEDGTFKHYFTTDDAQVWYGRGKFSDKRNRRTLRFQDPDTTAKFDAGLVHYEANFERVLKIKKGSFKSKDYYGTTRRKNVIFEKWKKG